MDKSSRLDIPIEEQRAAWNQWNTQTARGYERRIELVFVRARRRDGPLS